MDKNPFNLKSREEKPEGFLDTDEFFLFLEKKKIIIRKDNLPRFCQGNGIQMLKFKRIGKWGTPPTCFKIPNEKKIEQIKNNLMFTNKSVLGLKLVKKKEKKILQIFDEAKNQKESKSSIAQKTSEALGVPCTRKLVRRVLNEKRSLKLNKLK